MGIFHDFQKSLLVEKIFLSKCPQYLYLFMQAHPFSMYISLCPRNFGHVERPVVHGDVRFDQNPVFEVVRSPPDDFHVPFERFDDTGEVAGRKAKRAIKDDPTDRI